jgi:hypothetical protein
MSDETATYDQSISQSHAARVPVGEVVGPSLQVPIQLANENRNRLESLATVRHLEQLFPLPLNRLLRPKHIEKPPVATFAVPIPAQWLDRQLYVRTPGGNSPSETTLSSSGVTTSSATLSGSVIPYGSDARYWFNDGTDYFFVSSLQTARVDVGSGGNMVFRGRQHGGTGAESDVVLSVAGVESCRYGCAARRQPESSFCAVKTAKAA